MKITRYENNTIRRDESHELPKVTFWLVGINALGEKGNQFSAIDRCRYSHNLLLIMPRSVAFLTKTWCFYRGRYGNNLLIDVGSTAVLWCYAFFKIQKNAVNTRVRKSYCCTSGGINLFRRNSSSQANKPSCVGHWHWNWLVWHSNSIARDTGGMGYIHTQVYITSSRNTDTGGQS